MLDFATIKALVFDMDGVLWRGEQALPGLTELFTFLRARQLPYLLATNNSRRTQADYVTKLAKLGVADVPLESILTSALATALHLKSHYATGTRVHVVGENGLRHEIEAAGFVLADENVQAVVAGIDTSFTYEKARVACQLLLAGATFFATNADRNIPMENSLAPGAGSILAMLEMATDRKPTVIGKPHPAMFETALRELGTRASHTLMVGDRLNTDIEGAHHTGLRSALVLTGVNSREDALAYHIQPDVIVDNLPALMRCFA